MSWNWRFRIVTYSGFIIRHAERNAWSDLSFVIRARIWWWLLIFAYRSNCSNPSNKIGHSWSVYFSWGLTHLINIYFTNHTFYSQRSFLQNISQSMSKNFNFENKFTKRKFRTTLIHSYQEQDDNNDVLMICADGVQKCSEVIQTFVLIFGTL